MRLKANDKKTKTMNKIWEMKFLHILALVVVTLTFFFDFSMFFIKYPEANRDMINSVSGILNSGALIMVLSFFYGSSKSSHDKTDMINTINKENSEVK